MQRRPSGRAKEVQDHIPFVYTNETREPGIKVTPLHGRVDVQVLRYRAIDWWHPSGGR